MNIIRIFNLSFQIWGSILALTIIICLTVLKRLKRSSDRFYVGMLFFHMGNMLMDSVAFYFRGRAGFWNSIGVRASNYIAFLCGYILVFMFVGFEKTYLERKLRKKMGNHIMILSLALLGIQCVLLTVNLFVPFMYQIDAQNLYSRLPGYPLNYIFPGGALLAAMYTIWKYRRQLEKWEVFSFIMYILMPFITMVLTIYFYGFVFGHLGNTISLTIMYVYLQSEHGRREAEREKELIQMRITVMMSQIRPHFLFNALNSIEYLCSIGSKDAAAAVNHFANYLRGNMNSLTQNTPVMFEKELEHLENYLYIEHIRFPHIEIRYNLKSMDFRLPSLTLQPLVENAIKHGLATKEENAKIMIESFEDEDYYYIRVTDNGCGFDAQMTGNDEREHVGMENTKNRLSMMCGGRLEIESKIGEGTSALIRIPK